MGLTGFDVKEGPMSRRVTMTDTGRRVVRSPESEPTA
jgi:hypothetical protein